MQFVKIKNCGLEPFFSTVITSENAGYQKPRKEIFEYAIKSANARKNESVMIGDYFKIDIEGAKNAGIDQVFFNPYSVQLPEAVTFEINSIKELQNIF